LLCGDVAVRKHHSCGRFDTLTNVIIFGAFGYDTPWFSQKLIAFVRRIVSSAMRG
jgi:hypothetical protein